MEEIDNIFLNNIEKEAAKLLNIKNEPVDDEFDDEFFQILEQIARDNIDNFQ